MEGTGKAAQRAFNKDTTDLFQYVARGTCVTECRGAPAPDTAFDTKPSERHTKGRDVVSEETRQLIRDLNKADVALFEFAKAEFEAAQHAHREFCCGSGGG